MSESQDFSKMSGPELVAEYNKRATGAGLKPVKRFADRESAVRRVKELVTNSIGGGSTATAQKVPGGSGPSKVLEAFGARKGTNRELLLLALASHFGQQVKVSALLQKVYGSTNDKNKGALKMVMKGAYDMIKKGRLSYEIKREKETDSYGLYSK